MEAPKQIFSDIKNWIKLCLVRYALAPRRQNRDVALATVRVTQNDEILSKAPGLELVDEPHSNHYPMPLNVAGKDNCQVGRVRLDCALDNGLSFWVSGDQLLKGAALNAVQIAELL
jgi:aspartate-semialdehyde dehydrogenase